MADLGNVGNDYINYSIIKSEPSGEYVHRRIWDAKSLRNFGSFEIENGHVVTTSTTIEFNKLPIMLNVPWYVPTGTSQIKVDCILSADAVSLYPTEKPSVYINGLLISEGTVVSTRQTITIDYFRELGTDLFHKEVTVGLVYYSHYNYLAKCTWFINNTNGIIDEPFNSASIGGSSNCSYQIGEEQPIDYGNILLTAEDIPAKTLTFTIPVNTVASTTVDAQILLTLSPYGSNANGTIEDIFTEVGALHQKIYVKDAGVSMKLDIETWNSVDNFAKVWVTIPSLTTALKDIVLHYDSTVLDNPDSSLFNIIGF